MFRANLGQAGLDQIVEDDCILGRHDRIIDASLKYCRAFVT
jgi:hypothetical protein